MVKVSVIIPTYNRCNLVHSAISSVLDQTFQDYEIVIVDDASTDNTESIVKGISSPKIKYIKHCTNNGESESRNTGIQNSKGEFIAFIDDDDEWMPEKLERQMQLIDQCGKHVGCIYTGILMIDLESGILIDKVVPQKRGFIYDDLLVENCAIAPSTVLLREECFRRVGLFDRSIKYGPDYDMWMRISKEYHFDYISEPLVKYYVHKNKLSGNYQNFIKGAEAILSKYEEVFLTHKKAHSRHIFELGLAYCECKMHSQGRKALLEAIYLYPWEKRYHTNFVLSLFGGQVFRYVKQLKQWMRYYLRLVFDYMYRVRS